MKSASDSSTRGAARGARGDSRAALRADWAAGFEAFYVHYPRKRGKIAARKAFNALCPTKREQFREKFESIMMSLDDMKSNEWKNREPQHIPYPASWLRAEEF